MKVFDRSSWNLLGPDERHWAYLNEEAILPIAIIAKHMPPGTVLFEKELEAIDYKLNNLAKIQRILEKRKRILGHSEIDRRNERDAEDERIFNQVTGR